MQVLFYIALALVLAIAATTTAIQRQSDAPRAVVSASEQVDRYRLFMYVASTYMKGYSGGPGIVTWEMMKSIPTLPSGAKATGMPPSWKVIVSSDNTWVACTDLDERAIGAFQQLAVQTGQRLQQTQLAGHSFIVVGTADDTGKAAQCN